MRFPPVVAHAALVSALAEALSLWSPGMDMAQPYTLGAAAYANIAIGRSRCPAASKADRKSVAAGKSVAVRVDLGGPRLIKLNNQTTIPQPQHTNPDKKRHTSDKED